MRITKTGRQIDLGCGGNKRDGFIGIDRLDFGQEIVWDVRNGLPFIDETIDEIYSSHFFEHLTYSELEPLMEELKRVMSANATIKIIVPHKTTTGAWDYAHRTFWNEKRFKGFLPSAGFNIISMEENGGNLIVNANKR